MNHEKTIEITVGPKLSDIIGNEYTIILSFSISYSINYCFLRYTSFDIHSKNHIIF